MKDQTPTHPSTPQSNNGGDSISPLPKQLSPKDIAHLAELNKKIENHPVVVVATALQKLDEKELQDLGQTITPDIARLYEKAFGPAILHVLSSITPSDDEIDDNDKPSAETDDKLDSADNDDGQKLSADEVAILEKEIRGLMRDPRYWREHDPQQLAKVAQAFEKLYG
ncbi:MAG: hypothetical protein ACR2NY_06315 [Alphaproteobacteria bacterium]